MSIHSNSERKTISSISIIALGIALLFFAPSLRGFAVFGNGDEPAKKIYVCPPCDSECDKVEHEEPGICAVCNMKLVEKSSLHAEGDPGEMVYMCPPCDSECDKLVHEKAGICEACGMTLIAVKKKAEKDE